LYLAVIFSLKFFRLLSFSMFFSVLLSTFNFQLLILNSLRVLCGEYPHTPASPTIRRSSLTLQCSAGLLCQPIHILQRPVVLLLPYLSCTSPFPVCLGFALNF
jgi:hypothetical protein